MRNKQLRSYLLSLTVSLLCCSVAFAQTNIVEATQGKDSPKSSLTITAVAAADRVRITAPASVMQMRVEVYDGNGIRVWDSEIHGNVIDWHVQDGQDQRAAVGDYVCVVTVKNVAGHVTRKLGSIGVREKDLRVERIETGQISAPQSQTIGPLEEDASWTILTEDQNQTPTVIAHDGNDGQIVRGRGAIAFRLGDFFSGKNFEQMRLTEGGNLGIGTAKPKFKLDVAGAIRAREGFVFSNGSRLNLNDKGVLTLTDSDGNIIPKAAGTGTQNQLAKWVETGGSGTLGNSAVTEVGGKLGVGTNVPNFELTMLGNDIGLQLISPATGTGPSDGFRFGIDSTNKAFLWNQEPTDMYFGTSASERLRITSTGNVGIGTTNPAFSLDVAGRIRLRQNPGDFHSTNTAGMWLSQNSAPDAAFIGMFDNFHVGLYGNNGAGWKFVMDTFVGHVGIGTLLPGAVLHVVGTQPPTEIGGGDDAPEVLHVTGGQGGNGDPGGDGASIVLEAGAGGNQTAGGSGGGGDGGSILLQPGQGGFAGGVVDGAPGVVSLAPFAGDVGIGTGVPLAKLDVKGNAFVRGAGGIANNVGAGEFHIGYGLVGAGTVGSVSRLAIQPYGHTGGPWKFIARDDSSKAYLDWVYGNSLSGITLDSQGKVGIGTTAPSQKLTVAGIVQSTGGFQFPDGSVQTSAAAYTKTTSDAVVLSGAPTSIGQLSLTTGAYMVIVNMNASNLTVPSGNRTLICQFTNEAPYVVDIAGGARSTLTFHSVLNVSSGSVGVTCAVQQGDGIQVFDRRLTATRLGAIVVQ